MLVHGYLVTLGTTKALIIFGFFHGSWLVVNGKCRCGENNCQSSMIQSVDLRQNPEKDDVQETVLDAACFTCSVHEIRYESLKEEGKKYRRKKRRLHWLN